MKYERQKTVMKDSVGLKTTPWKFRFLMLICIVLVSCLLAVILHNWGAVPAHALEIPSDYGTGYSPAEKLDNLENGQSSEGIQCIDKSSKVYALSFSDTGDVNGLVTLARISHNSDLKDYTFQISYNGTITLDVKYRDESPVSAESFFGIGNEEHPFKGKIIIRGSAGNTYIVIKEDGWRFLFNNISNEASITNEGNYRLYSSYDSSASVENPGPQTVNSFAFCKTLTVTKDDCALDLSGYGFGDEDSTGNSGALVQGSGKTAVFACEVKKTEGASSFSVDLSKSLSSGEYIVTNNDDDAGGLIGSVEAGVNMEIGLPDSLNFRVTSGGDKTNAGILIGSNNGSVTFVRGSNRTNDNAVSFSGTVSATGSAGLIGANEAGSTAVFSENVSVNGLSASGLRAGGLAGTAKGTITVNEVEIKNSTFTKVSASDAVRLGGAIGSVDVVAGGLRIAEGGSVQLSGNTFSAENTNACYIGGYIGFLSTSNENLQNVTVNNTTVTGNANSANRIGGYIGSLSTTGDFSLTLGNDTSVFNFNGISAGVCGGVIGDVNSLLQNTVLISGTEESYGTIQCKVNNGTDANVGGLVGKISKGYVKVDNLSLDNTINRAASAADLVGSISAGAMLDVGNLSLREVNGSVLVGQTGQSSIVRLGGTITDTSSSVVSIVYQQNASLIYKEVGCIYSGAISSNNDIGNYGQVIRNDILQVIKFNDHQVSITSPLDGSDAISISNAADFAKLAITFHTKGAISGVTGAEYSALFGKTINLTGDVSLVNAGIEQLTPANDMTVPFTGTVNGGGHTVTLAIGQNISEAYPGVKAGTNNVRSSLGLFAYIKNATAENVKIGGQISLCLPDANQYVGSLAGKADGELTLGNCEVDTVITIANGVASKRNNTSLYVGGMAGYIGDVSSLSVTGCTLGARITDNTAYNNSVLTLSLGGLGGYVKYTGSSDIDFTNNIIKTNITKSSAYTDLKMGGFIGELVCSNYVIVDLSGTTANGVSLTSTAATGSAGGILGYSFDKCHVILDGAYTGTVSTGSASLGGLLYTLNGRLTVDNGFSMSGTTLTATGDLCGLLLADGKNAIVTIKSDASGFDNVTADGFDLFVGENITEYATVDVAASGGIVTVETGDGIGKLPGSGSEWYTLINARPNTKTRYYFNIAGLENKTNASETINNAADLIYWHIYDYAQSLPAYVKTDFFGSTAVNNISSVTANIDMSGYCFYPTKKEAVTVDFKNYSLTFGKPAYVDATNQLFGLQAGLLSDISANSATTTVNIRNIKLSGTASYLGGSVPGSGALICGTVYGSQSGNTRYDVNLTLSNAVISGISVEGSADYRPLLINRIASYVEATVSGVSQEEYDGISSAASSLIGRGGFMEGATPSSYIKMTLSGIVLDGKIGSTVFTKATLFYDVSYVSGSGSFIYNFNFDEDWGSSPLHQVTYGSELYFNEDQHQYFDKNINVNPQSMPTESSDVYNFSVYLPYVYVGYDQATGKVNLLFSVNRKGADFIEGWGTYRNPYIIRSAKQLEYLSKWLSGNNVTFNDGWQINFPQGNWSSVSSLNLTDYYPVQANGGKLYYGDTELSIDLLLSYLSGAYFKLEGTEFTLSSEYSGLGSTVYPFHGVVHGSGSIVIMPGTDAENAIGSYGYGFINVANGCAVYDLTIQYSTIVISSDEFTSDQNSTSGPNATALSTALPHFGGVIAWVVGGDNLIDTVSVTVDSVTPGASAAVCGGYVGLVSGGGVLLSNLWEVSINNSARLYHNNYIGRVLNGYAIAIDGNTYNNSKNFAGLGNYADFVIPAITKDTLTGHNKGFSANTFTPESAQDLLLFSFGMNSGAFTGNNGYAYGQTSLSRYGDYQYVGSATEGDVGEDGKYIDDTNKTSILLKYFGINAPTDLRNTSTGLTVNLTGTEYDMRDYGNAFRGMSGVYINSPTYKIVFFGGSDSVATIKLDMDMLQYAVGEKVNSTDASYSEADSIRNYGLFGRISSGVTFKNLTLTGKISVSCINRSNVVMESNPFSRLEWVNSWNNSCQVGGFVGYSAGAATFTSVSLNDIEVNSPDVCGGFVGRHASGNFTVNSGCSYQNATIKGKRHTGGVAGHVASGTVSVTGLTATDSTVEARVDLTYASGTLYGTAGGIFGQVGSSTTSVTLKDCTITKTAVVYTTNYKNTGELVASGGLVGISEKSVTAENCKVDGCVVLAVSKFDNGYNFPDKLTPKNVNILPQELRNALIYNGEKQNVANILAWLLEQTSTNGNGYSVGGAGGLIGQVRNSGFTLKGCTVSSESAPCVIIGFNNAGGLVGEHRKPPGDVSVTNCTVKTVGYDMYIIGGPRAAGVLAYRSTDQKPNYTLDGVQVVGTSDHPIRILGLVYSTSDAAGLFGEPSSVNLTVNNCNISYCIMGGVKAGGVCSTVSKVSTIALTNIHVSNNLIYSKNYNTNQFRAGALFGEVTNVAVTANINGAYVGKNCIVGIKGAGGLAGRLQSGNTLSAKYVILDDNVIRKLNSTNVSNFTFAASSLNNGAAATALIKSSDFTDVGLIASSNSGNVTVIAVSCNAPDAGTTKQMNFGSGSGTVVYAAYGAQDKYEEYKAMTDEDSQTPQQIAIEKMNLIVTTSDGSLTLNGDSVTTVDIGTVEAPNIIKTPENIVTLQWWPSYGVFSFGDTTITNMEELVSGITENKTLPLLCLQSDTDTTMKNYLNMLTGGGFADAVTKGIVTVDSKRYSVDENGNLTDLNESGSVVLDGSTFRVGIYDNLEGDSKTLTVLTVTFKDSAKNDVYTMHLAIYYHRSVNIKTFVVPLEGEHYYIPSFLNFGTEPTGSLRANVSYGSPFTLYVEYNYNDMAMKLEQMKNFNKQIELTQSNGNSDESAGIESGTVFILIDLNSETPAGYSYYTLTLSEKTRFIDFKSFTNGEKEFTHIDLTYLQTIAHLLDNRVCKDTGDNDCVYTEKYILAVFPIQNNTDSAFTYNMKAVIDEQQRKETNIVVKYLKSVYAQVSVWGSPTVEQTPSYNGNNQEDKQFSNRDKSIIMNIDTTVVFPKDYILSLGANADSSVYGTHILQLRNEDNRYVELPMRTVFKVTLPDGTVIHREELTEPTSRLRFSVGSLLGSDKNITTVDGIGTVNMEYRIELDFSEVNSDDFYKAFYASGKSKYTLEDSIYISGNEELQSGGSLGKSYLEYTVDITSAVKLAVVPDDNRYLGINIYKQEDQTNSGKIGFTVSANFDTFANKEFNKVTASFSVSKKVYNNGKGKYEYVAPDSTDLLKWSVYAGDEIVEGNKVVNSDDLTKTANDKEYVGNYLLEIDLNSIPDAADLTDFLTNYRLIVTVSATDTGGDTISASEYFVFLICDLNTEVS